MLQRRAIWVLGFALLVIAVTWQSPEARRLVLASLADAYLQVSAFVAATLALFYGLERLFKVDAGALMERHARWQVPAAAFLGALPGCGGAIVVVTQYVRGHVGFGAMVAVLTATMGDAAFLLLAQEPATGLAIFGLGLAVGVLSGWIVDAIHGPGFLRQQHKPRATVATAGNDAGPVRHLNGLWVAVMVPGLVLGVLTAFQVDADALFGTTFIPQPTVWLGVAGSLLAIAMWALSPSESLAENVSAGTSGCETGLCGRAGGDTLDRIVGDTNFVTVWVVLAYLSYGLGLFLTGIDLKAVFTVWGPAVPLIGILVGFLPGCGPQIVVTTLYLNGVVPLSAQLGNAISNDGDALFPAIALAPRVAVVATLYSALPALMVAYAYWWIWE
jgi:hypothetical protein